MIKQIQLNKFTPFLEREKRGGNGAHRGTVLVLEVRLDGLIRQLSNSGWWCGGECQSLHRSRAHVKGCSGKVHAHDQDFCEPIDSCYHELWLRVGSTHLYEPFWK